MKDNLQAATQFRMQEIHTPSAFEGALWAAVGVKDARTIFHAPPGCYINQHVNILVNDWTTELYSTNLSYANVMQGAEEKLEVTMRKVLAKKPAAVIIVTAPSVEVTRDDVEGVAHKVGFKDTIIIRPPIGGTVGEGKDEAFLQMLSIMKPAKKKIKNAVNIIGPTFSTFNWQADVFELKRMLSLIGVKVNAVMSAGATVAELKKAPQAALNLCIYPYDCGQKVAAEMQKRFDVPYLDDIIPIGFENSSAWLQKIGRLLNIDAAAAIKDEMTNAWEFVRSNMVFSVAFEMSAALSLENNNTHAVGISRFLKNEMGMDVVMCAVSSPAAGEKIREVCDTVMISPTIDDKREQFVAKSPMVIFGNFYDKKVSMDEGFTNFIFADIPTIGYLNTENCPFMGFMGAKYLVQAIVNEVYMKIFLETKGEIAGPISYGDIPWDTAAQEAMMKVSEMIPHFIRATAMKKLQQVAEQMAKERNSSITLAIMQEVADKYTPTKFKAKFSSVFDGVEGFPAEEEEEVPIDQLPYVMEWEDTAKQSLEEVPSPFRVAAVSGTEEYARNHGYTKITKQVMEEFRKELGM
jgi:light-independent protochlorophyllide reductase B subunit